MAESGTKNIDSKIMEAASEWQMKLASDDVSDVDIEQHMEWLLASPEHVAAEELVAATMKQATVYEQAARAIFAEDFTEVKSHRTPPNEWTRFFTDWGWPKYGAATALVAVLLLVTVLPNVGLMDSPNTSRLYTVQNGQVQNFSLDDGTRVALFAGTRMSVLMEDEARVVNLEQGRAFFDVAPNAGRPFYVNTDRRQVKVVGTRFEVVSNDMLDQVSVNEGLVSVSSKSTEESRILPVLIEPGTVALYRQQDQSPVLTKRSPETIGAWKEGVLTFKQAPLADVVAAVNDLFPSKPIILADENLAVVSFSGTLAVSSVEKMAQQLGSFLALDVRVEDTRILLVSR